MNLGKWVIPFGKHTGKALEDIPASYLLWFALENQYPPDEIKKYVNMHRKTLEQEVKESNWKFKGK